MTFQGPNERPDPGLAPQDRASLQPADWEDRAPPIEMPRTRNMDWKPDLVLDSTDWIQRALMGDEKAIREVCLVVAPLLLAEVQRLRRA